MQPCRVKQAQRCRESCRPQAVLQQPLLVRWPRQQLSSNKRYTSNAYAGQCAKGGCGAVNRARGVVQKCNNRPIGTCKEKHTRGCQSISSADGLLLKQSVFLLPIKNVQQRRRMPWSDT
jgi:hypothetical protein